MKKFYLVFIMTLMAVFTANAQTAIETSRITDNIYVGIGGGVTTPLNIHDFESVFPLNTAAKVVVGKNITPVLGIEIEGMSLLNHNGFADVKTLFKTVNVNIGPTINLSNLFFGYKGKPRVFEFGLNGGLGWLHQFAVPGETKDDFLSAKTAADFRLFLGKTRPIALTVSPGVYWNLNGVDGTIRDIKFDKNHAQLAVMATLTYHFKNKNGLRYFKTYDVGAMNDEINRLNEELAKKPDTVTIIKTTAPVVIAPVNPVTIFFAKGSADLTTESQRVLDEVEKKFAYSVEGFASPEGTEEFNNDLSQRRAEAVANYLRARNVKVVNVKGRGVAYGEATNRVVLVTVTE